MVIPTRDRPELARRAVHSALAQKDVDVEVVVVDDGGSWPLADLLDVDDPRVRTIRHDSSKGVAAARNTGIRMASCEWLAFLDDDDLWAPHKLRTQLEAALENDSQWCITAALRIDYDRVIESVHECPPNAEEVEKRLCRFNAVPGGGSGVLVARDAITQIGEFDESVSMLADWDMWHRLAHAFPAAIVHEPLVGYTTHASSMTATFRDHNGEADRLDQLSSKYCDSNDEVRRVIYLNWLAHSLVRHDRKRAAKLKAQLAFKSRSISGLAMAARFLLVPPTFSIKRTLRLAPALERARAGKSIDARMAMMAMTTSNSIRVKPRRLAPLNR